MVDTESPLKSKISLISEVDFVPEKCCQPLPCATCQQRRCIPIIYDHVTVVPPGGWMRKVGPFYGQPLNAL